MKKLMLLVVSISALLLVSCSMEDVKEGTKGVLIKRPYFIGSDGVDILEPGRHTIAGSSSLVLVDVKPDKKKEIFNDLNTKDNVPVDFDISFTFQLIPSEVHKLYSNFGLDYYEKSLEQELRNLTRDKCKQYDMNPLTNSVVVSNEINSFVMSEGNKIIGKLGIPVKLIAVNMGSVNPPQQVITERGNTASAKQKEQTIIQETKNQKERQNSERERAKADRAYQDALGLSTSQFIQLQSLRIKEIAYLKTSTITIIEGGKVGMNKNVE